MKWIFLFSISLLISSCQNKTNRTYLNFKILKKNEIIEGNNNKKAIGYLISTEIINDTDTNLKFWIMSDSWYDNFGYNEHFQFFDKNSNKSIPELKVIKSSESMTFVAKLWVSDSIKKSRINELKAGFVLIYEHEYKKLHGMQSIPEIAKQKQKMNRDLIWGNIKLE
jgi:hypothetical protein